VFKKPPQDEVHIEDVKQVNGQWLVAGTSGVILIVVGMGPTMRQAQAQVYSRIKNVLIPNMYYRTDIGDRWVEDTDRLQHLGLPALVRSVSAKRASGRIDSAHDVPEGLQPPNPSFRLLALTL